MDPGGGSAQQIKIVGSSTVYPFTTAVAEEFQRANPGISVIVESTGTGAGIKLFCGGVGGQFPDIVNASRPMKKSEYADCAKAGAKNVIEVPIGIDGLTLIEAKGQPPLNLTVEPTSTRRSPPIRSARAPTRRRPGRTSIRRFRRPRSACSARRRRRARATAWPN